MRLSDGTPDIIALRRATGPWRVCWGAGRNYGLLGTAPRRCPGAYVVCAWSVLKDYVYFD